jgi:hypothetical protein
MKRLIILVLLALIVPCAAFAQAQAVQPPTPGPDVQRMAFMLGNWQEEIEVRQSPLGPAGKESRTTNCEWFTGSFQMVCRSESHGPRGNSANMSILAWDAGRKTYVGFGIGSNGSVIQNTGQVSGNTWTFITEAPVPVAELGKTARLRWTIVETSPTLQTNRFEVSLDGGAWTLVAEGKSTKMK